jgi:5'-AMP-activated protein kinase regulatory beta subunit
MFICKRRKPMNKRAKVQKVKRRKVTFLYKDPNARDVALMGDFNNWDPKKHPMKNDGSGIWTKSVILAPGRYEYKFIADGEWKTDPSNHIKCLNCYGTYNNIISLPPK